MAFARAPQYSAGRALTRKPRRKVVAPKTFQAPYAQKTGPGMGFVPGRVLAKPKLKKAVAPAPPPAAPPPQAPVPVQDPVPAQQPVRGPAPMTPQSADARIGAGEQYQYNMGDINSQLMEAALRFGGIPQVQQYGFEKVPDPNAPGGFRVVDSSNMRDVLQNSPNSAVATIGRNLEAQRRAEQQGQNTQNTFFSGLHLAAQREHEDDAGRQRLAAQAEYEDAVRRLNAALMGYRGERDTAYRGALDAEIEAAKANEPEAREEPLPEEKSPTAEAEAAPAPKAKTKATPKKPKKKTRRKGHAGVGKAIGR